jgi:glycosyltransferase involved in cell wall biosynthesis
MNVLYVHDRFGPLAGAEAHLHLTASELARRGHQLALLHGPPTGRDPHAWSIPFPHRFALGSTDNSPLTRRALQEFQPDLVFVHKMGDLSVIQPLVDSGLPLVHMVHDHDLYCLRSYKYNVFTRRICTRAASAWCVFPCLAPLARNRQGPLPFKWASYSAKRREITLKQRFHRMIVVTPFMRDELTRNGFDPKRIEIHPPVPRHSDPGIHSSFSDRNLILFAGQVIRGKGVDILLQSLTHVRNRFECAILGDGNHRPHCERLTRKLGLADRVRFHGFIPHDQLKAHYQECSVVAIPSVWPEPIATIGLEVMRYALPIVAFDAGGIRDWLQDGYNGYLVPWMDRATFAARLDQLLADKSLARQLGRNGLARVTERFDFERHILDLENLFHRVCSECRTAA